jgi:hypothetical protein
LEAEMTNGAYERHAKGIRILPGQWRPHYPFEQIAWVSPPWPSQDYLWLDFPEAIFTDVGLIYLSHVNPDFPVVFPDLPKVAWQRDGNRLSFARLLPNGVKFGGSLAANSETTIALELFIENGSAEPLTGIRLQTCAYLRAIKEFADYTVTNKFIRIAKAGWIDFEQAQSFPETGQYGLGFRGEGPTIADWPVFVTVSNVAQRLVAMTWYQSSASIISNPKHPCMHVDPRFPDLAPSQRGMIRGELLFFEGAVEQFGDWFMERQA